MLLWGEIARQQRERIKLLPLHQGRVCCRGDRAGAGIGVTTAEKADGRFAAGTCPLHAGAVQ